MMSRCGSELESNCMSARRDATNDWLSEGSVNRKMGVSLDGCGGGRVWWNGSKATDEVKVLEFEGAR